MEQERVIRALQQVADENGVPLELVMQEIEQIIDYGTRSDDPEIQNQWAKIPSKGGRSTVIELVSWLTEEAMKKKRQQ